MSHKGILKSSDGSKDDDDADDHSKKNVTFAELPKYDRPPKTVKKILILGWKPAGDATKGEASSTEAAEDEVSKDESS